MTSPTIPLDILTIYSPLVTLLSKRSSVASDKDTSMQYRSRICISRNHSSGLLRWSCLQTQEGQRGREFHLVGHGSSERPTTSSVWPSNHWEDYRSCALPLYRSFLKRCSLTNKAVGTIWRAWTKPPQMRQGPDPCPPLLLDESPSACGPWARV